jgi:NifU-like protein involved in Fe-S cluster formation
LSQTVLASTGQTAAHGCGSSTASSILTSRGILRKNLADAVEFEQAATVKKFATLADPRFLI